MNLVRTAQSPLIFEGMEVLDMKDGDGNIELYVDVKEDMMNPNGIMHGGMIFTLADMCAGLGAYSLGYKVSTIQSNINYIRPVTEGRLYAKNILKHSGRTTIVSNVEIRNDQGKIVSTSSFTLAVLAKIEDEE